MRAFFEWLRHWSKDALAAATRPAAVRGLGERRVGAAIAHLATLTIIFWVLPFAVTFFVGAHQGIAALDEGLRTRVPAGATFELKDGKLSDNLQDPLVVRDPDFTLIVNTASSTMDLAATETGIVVTNGGVFQQDGARRESISFASAPPFKLSREDLQADLARWAPLALFVGSLCVLLLVFSILLAGFLLNAAFHALALWLALKIAKRSWDWKRAFVTSAYAATGPLFLQALLSLGAGPGFDVIPMLLYWGILGWILYDAVRGAKAPGKDGPDEREKTADSPRPEGPA